MVDRFQELKAIYPQYANRFDLPVMTRWEESKEKILNCDLVFCCLPHGTTQEIIKELATKSSKLKIVVSVSHNYFLD